MDCCRGMLLGCFGGLLGAFLPSGCALAPGPLPPDALRATVAVSSFDNKTGFQGQWHLGDGMADLLVSELVRADRFDVLERQHLGNVVDEIQRQGDEFFRPEGKVEVGHLKNARFLIRGEISDFDQVRGGSFSFLFKYVFFGGKAYTARVGLTLTIVDVETGEIVASVHSDGHAGARQAFAEGGYDRIAFGGDAFFRTPIGKATREAIREGLYRVIESVPVERWRPMIAATSGSSIVINGGIRRGVLRGMVYTVHERARPVTDPQTGDIITFLPGPVVGSVQITDVEEDAAYAIVVEGEGFGRGQWLSPAVAARAPLELVR